MNETAITVFTGTALHAILAHWLAKLPKSFAQRILRRLYPTERLVHDISFSCVTDSADIRLATQEFLLKIEITNVLPFDVILKHIEFDVMLNQSCRLISIHYSRSITLPRSAKKIIKFPTFQLSANQVQTAKTAQKSLWLTAGEADLETSYGTQFVINIHELICTPNIC